MQINLRTLSRQYASGILTKTEYRKARTDLLEYMVDDDLTVPQTTLTDESAKEDKEQTTSPSKSD